MFLARVLCLCLAVSLAKMVESNQINYYLLQDFLSRVHNEPEQQQQQQLDSADNNILFDSNVCILFCFLCHLLY